MGGWHTMYTGDDNGNMGSGYGSYIPYLEHDETYVNGLPEKEYWARVKKNQKKAKELK